MWEVGRAGSGEGWAERGAAGMWANRRGWYDMAQSGSRASLPRDHLGLVIFLG